MHKKALKVDSIDHIAKLFFTVSFSGFKLSHCFSFGHFIQVASTELFLQPWQKNYTAHEISPSSFINDPSSHPNVFSVSFYSALLVAVCALCFMHSAELFSSVYVFSSLSSFLLFHVCRYLWILKVSFFLVFSFLFCFCFCFMLCCFFCFFFCALLCDASIKSYRVFLCCLRFAPETHWDFLLCVGWIKGKV